MSESFGGYVRNLTEWRNAKLVATENKKSRPIKNTPEIPSLPAVRVMPYPKSQGTK